MTTNTAKVRVVDLVFDADGRPIVDEHGKQRRNGGGYLYGRRQYLPGDVIEMPVNVAREELQLCGFSMDTNGHSGRHALLEPLEWHEKRMERAAAEAKGKEAEREAFARMSQDLQAEREQQLKLQQMIQEREAARVRDVAAARAEVPADVQARLDAQAQQIKDLIEKVEAAQRSGKGR